MYNFVFDFACEKGMISMDVDSAMAMWDVLIGEQKCKFMNKWKAFIHEKF